MRLVNIALNVALTLTLVIVPIVFTMQGRGGFGLVVTVIAIMIALFYVNLDKFVRYKIDSKAFTLEAELRETIDKAYAALDDLKELGLALSGPMISNLAMSGQHLKVLTMKYKLDSVAEITDTLRKLGANDEEIEKVCEFLYRKVWGILARNALSSLRPEGWEQMEAFEHFSDWDFPYWEKEQIERLIKDHSLEVNDDAKEWLADLDYFMQTKKLRRPDAWESGWQF